MRDYVFKFNAAGDSQALEVTSGYIRFYELTSGGGIDARIVVKSLGGGSSAELLPGEGFYLPRDERGWIIQNASGGAMAGKVKLASVGERFEAGRLLGTVAVVDSNYSLATSGLAFMSYYGYTPAAGTLAHIQVLNPTGSAKTVEVKSVQLGTGGAAGLAVHLTSGVVLATAVAGSVSSKLASGGDAPVCEVRYQNAAASVVGTRQIMGPLLSASGWMEKEFPVPLVLNPGDGVVAMCGSLGVSLTFGAELVERSL